MPDWMRNHPGQKSAWPVLTQFLALQAGWQSGKTDYLVRWCLRQMKRRGPGEALVCAPSHPLLIVAAQPRLVKAIESRGLGEHKKGDNYIHVPYSSLKRCGWTGDRGDLDIFFRHTQEAKHVEAVTAKWIAADECGQMSDEVGEAIQGRVSATGGEVCLISRPYYDNWFRRLCETPSGLVTVVNFASWDNPGWRPDLRAVPGAIGEEVERLKRSMPLWRFQMKYGGKFTRPAGAILDNWEDRHEVEPFVPDADWKRYTFHDFGPVHAFVISVAEHPTEKDFEGYPVLYCYREHFPNKGYATWQLVRDVKKADLVDFSEWAGRNSKPVPEWKPRGIGGNHTENDWRKDYTNAGLNVEQPKITDPLTQIDRLYACIGRGGLKVGKNCRTLIQMMKSWSWEVDDLGEPIPGKIADDVKFHGPAALRYGVSQLRPNKKEQEDEDPGPMEGSQEWLRQRLGQT